MCCEGAKVVGKCSICGKDIYNMGYEMPDNIDNANYIHFENYNGTYMIYGAYGSTTLDFCNAFVSDKEIFNKIKENDYYMTNNIKPKRVKNRGYICDDCVKNLIEEKKIFIVDNDLGLPILDDTKSDYYVTIPRRCICIKYNDGVERFKSIIRETFDRYKVYNNVDVFDNEDGITIIFDSKYKERNKKFIVHKNEVFIMYSNDEFEVMDDNIFKNKFTNGVY